MAFGYIVFTEEVCVHRVQEMRHTKEANPKSVERAYVLCFDDSARHWEVCYWSSNAGRWFRPDGEAPQFSASYWIPCSGNTGGTENAEISNVFASAEPI